MDAIRRKKILCSKNNVNFYFKLKRVLNINEGDFFRYNMNLNSGFHLSIFHGSFKNNNRGFTKFHLLMSLLRFYLHYIHRPSFCLPNPRSHDLWFMISFVQRSCFTSFRMNSYFRKMSWLENMILRIESLENIALDRYG